jgi:hypothetical protein
MDRAQSEFLIEGNPMMECLEIWIENPNNVEREVKVSQLFDEFSTIALEHKIGFSFKSARSMGMHLRHVLSNFQNYFDITERQINRAWHYTFRPKSEENPYETNETL